MASENLAKLINKRETIGSQAKRFLEYVKLFESEQKTSFVELQTRLEKK